MLANKQPLIYQPGEKGNYDNINFIVLALVVEKVSGMDYFYVDSSYLQVLVRYGVIMLVVLCLAMMAVQCYSVVTKNIYLCMGCSLFLIHCITDPQLLSFRYNPFIIISVACVGMIKSKKEFFERNRNEKEYE